MNELMHVDHAGYEIAMGTAVAMHLSGCAMSTIVSMTGIGRGEFRHQAENVESERRLMVKLCRIRRVARTGG